MRTSASADLAESRLLRLQPVSDVWGLDRGLPVDRHYIHDFLSRRSNEIRGDVLEVKDRAYTLAFGSAVTSSAVLDVNPANPEATVIADLTVPGSLPHAAFDCFILTQTLHFLYDLQTSVRNSFSCLRPGGVLLATLPCVSRMDPDILDGVDQWRITPPSARTLFEAEFGAGNIDVEVFGNVLVCCAFLMGLAAEDLSASELEYFDPAFPLLVCVSAKRPHTAID